MFNFLFNYYWFGGGDVVTTPGHRTDLETVADGFIAVTPMHLDLTHHQSMERLEETRKKVNLVIRRLLNKENVLMPVGEPPKNKQEEQQALLAVHPNFVVS